MNMEIVKDDGLKYVKFEDIKLGECFGGTDHNYYIKVPFLEDKKIQQVNAVELSNGYVSFFTNQTTVLKINATIHVEE